MKNIVIAVVSAVVPFLLSAGVWTNLDAEHHYSGPSLTEKDLAGKVVLVDNWGVGCQPCLESLPRLQKVWQSFKNKPFMLIGSHCQGKQADKVGALVEKLGLTYPIYEGVGLAEGAPRFRAIPFLYVVNHRGRVVYAGKSEQEATEALVTAIADVGQPIFLCRGVVLPKRYKSFTKKMRLGATITGDLKKLEKEAAGKNARMAEEAQSILAAIERTKKEVREEIDAIRTRRPAEAIKLMKDFMKTWPKDGADYKAAIAELQKGL